MNQNDALHDYLVDRTLEAPRSTKPLRSTGEIYTLDLKNGISSFSLCAGGGLEGWAEEDITKLGRAVPQVQLCSTWELPGRTAKLCRHRHISRAKAVFGRD